MVNHTVHTTPDQYDDPTTNVRLEQSTTILPESPLYVPHQASTMNHMWHDGIPIDKPPQTPTIRKSGHLKKLKTMKRKYFVLWSGAVTTHAHLDYFDSEKKFRLNSCNPKRSIDLYTCFSINRKCDTKQKNAFIVYTKDDSLGMVADSEDDVERWVEMLQESHEEGFDIQGAPRPLYEHVWETTIQNQGLAKTSNLSGRYRVCLSDNSVSLVKVGGPRFIPCLLVFPEHVWETTIQNQGLAKTSNLSGRYRVCLSDNSVSLVKVGAEVPDVQFQFGGIRRCSYTPSTFIIEVGRYTSTGSGEIRMTVDDIIVAENMHDIILGALKGPTTVRSDSTARSLPHQDSTRSRTSSMGPSVSSRPRSVKVLEKPRPQTMYTTPTEAIAKENTPPLSEREMSVGSLRGRTGSTCSSSSSKFNVHSAPDKHTPPNVSLNTTISSLMEPVPTPDPLDQDYFNMMPAQSSRSSSVASKTSSRGSRDRLDSRGSVKVDGYMDMAPSSYMTPPTKTPSIDVPDAYIDMSPGQASMTASSSIESAGYLSMSPTGPNIPGAKMPPFATPSKSTDGGYFDMAPTAPTTDATPTDPMSSGYIAMRAKGYHPAQGCDFTELKPDRVVSYLSDDSISSQSNDAHKRAYSVGSRPLDKPAMTRYNSQAESSQKHTLEGSKSTSAPHLKIKAPFITSGASPTTLSSSYKSDDSESFMEIEFYRSRTASDSHGTRPRTVSESLPSRPRTSSFTQNIGQSRYAHRPRSSSHGQSSHLLINKPMYHHSIRTKSTELLKQVSTDSLGKSSRESLLSSNESLRKYAIEERARQSALSGGEYCDMKTSGGSVFAKQVSLPGKYPPNAVSLDTTSPISSESSPDGSSKGDSSSSPLLPRVSEATAYVDYDPAENVPSDCICHSYVNLDYEVPLIPVSEPPRPKPEKIPNTICDSSTSFTPLVHSSSEILICGLDDDKPTASDTKLPPTIPLNHHYVNVSPDTIRAATQESDVKNDPYVAYDPIDVEQVLAEDHARKAVLKDNRSSSLDHDRHKNKEVNEYMVMKPVGPVHDRGSSDGVIPHKHKKDHEHHHGHDHHHNHEHHHGHDHHHHNPEHHHTHDHHHEHHHGHKHKNEHKNTPHKNEHKDKTALAAGDHGLHTDVKIKPPALPNVMQAQPLLSYRDNGIFCIKKCPLRKISEAVEPPQDLIYNPDDSTTVQGISLDHTLRTNITHVHGMENYQTHPILGNPNKMRLQKCLSNVVESDTELNVSDDQIETDVFDESGSEINNDLDMSNTHAVDHQPLDFKSHPGESSTDEVFKLKASGMSTDLSASSSYSTNKLLDIMHQVHPDVHSANQQKSSTEHIESVTEQFESDTADLSSNNDVNKHPEDIKTATCLNSDYMTMSPVMSSNVETAAIEPTPQSPKSYVFNPSPEKMSPLSIICPPSQVLQTKQPSPRYASPKWKKQTCPLINSQNTSQKSPLNSPNISQKSLLNSQNISQISPSNSQNTSQKSPLNSQNIPQKSPLNNSQNISPNSPLNNSQNISPNSPLNISQNISQKSPLNSPNISQNCPLNNSQNNSSNISDSRTKSSPIESSGYADMDVTAVASHITQVKRSSYGDMDASAYASQITQVNSNSGYADMDTTAYSSQIDADKLNVNQHKSQKSLNKPNVCTALITDDDFEEISQASSDNSTSNLTDQKINTSQTRDTQSKLTSNKLDQCNIPSKENVPYANINVNIAVEHNLEQPTSSRSRHASKERNDQLTSVSTSGRASPVAKCMSNDYTNINSSDNKQLATKLHSPKSKSMSNPTKVDTQSKGMPTRLDSPRSKTISNESSLLNSQNNNQGTSYVNVNVLENDSEQISPRVTLETVNTDTNTSKTARTSEKSTSPRSKYSPLDQNITTNKNVYPNISTETNLDHSEAQSNCTSKDTTITKDPKTSQNTYVNVRKPEILPNQSPSPPNKSPQNSTPPIPQLVKGKSKVSQEEVTFKRYSVTYEANADIQDEYACLKLPDKTDATVTDIRDAKITDKAYVIDAKDDKLMEKIDVKVMEKRDRDSRDSKEDEDTFMSVSEVEDYKSEKMASIADDLICDKVTSFIAHDDSGISDTQWDLSTNKSTSRPGEKQRESVTSSTSVESSKASVKYPDKQRDSSSSSSSDASKQSYKTGKACEKRDSSSSTTSLEAHRPSSRQMQLDRQLSKQSTSSSTSVDMVNDMPFHSLSSPGPPIPKRGSTPNMSSYFDMDSGSADSISGDITASGSIDDECKLNYISVDVAKGKGRHSSGESVRETIEPCQYATIDFQKSELLSKSAKKQS